VSVKCEICNREFKNTQGLRGHKTFVHQIHSSSSKSATPLATEQLSKLEERLQKVEKITGLKEPGSLDQILGTDKTITEQLEQYTGRLAEFSVQLKELSQQLKLAASSAEVLNIKKQLTQLSEQVRRHDKWLTTSPLMLFLSQNSPDCPAFLLDLNRLKERVDNHQAAINLTRKKLDKEIRYSR
jgi:hypothetical protein